MQIDSEEELRKKIIKELRKNLTCVEIATNILGLTIEKSKSNKRYLKTMEHSSMVFDLKENIVYWNARSTKPYNVIDFYIEYSNLPAYKAIDKLIDYYNSRDPSKIQNIIYDEINNEAYRAESLILPNRYSTNDIVIDYLCNIRKLDINLINDLIDKEMLYEDIYHNVVFVGYDVMDKGEAVFGLRRGTDNGIFQNFKKFQTDCKGSFKHNGFYYSNIVDNTQKSDKLYVFESVIDGLSYITLNKDKNVNILCCSGTGAVLNMIKYNLINNFDLKNISQIELVLDNDEAGKVSISKIMEEFSKDVFTYDDKEYPINIDVKKSDYYLMYHNDRKEIKDVNQLLQAVTYLVENQVQTKEESFIFLRDNSTKRNSGQIEYENTDLIYGNINVLSTEQEEDELEL